MVGEHHPGEEGPAGAGEAFHEYTVLDSAGRLQVPREYLEQLSIGDRVTLDVKEEGILIRPVAGREAAGSPLLASLEDEEPPPAPRGGLRRWWPRAKKGGGSRKRGEVKD